MKINLVMIDPPNSNYLNVYTELIDFYYHTIQELGYEVIRSINAFKVDHLNIIVSYQALPFYPQMTNNKYIVLQLEQLSLDTGGYFSDKHRNFHNDALPLMKNALQVWDYSPENQKFLKSYNIDTRLIPLGFNEKLQRINPAPVKDIDVLFYGSTHERRFNIVKTLESLCKITAHFGVYGAIRDNLIARSKIVLNVHAYANLKIMEQVRLFYLLTNNCFVLSEECYSHPYGDGIITFPYEQIIEGVMTWLKKDQEREEVIVKGAEALKKLNTKELIKKALSEIKN